MKYKTLNTDEDINAALDEGWTLYGSPCVMPSSMGEHTMGFFQAMILKDGDGDNESSN